MRNEVYHVAVGAFGCTAVCDGTLTYGAPMFSTPAQLLFANAPADRLERALREHGIEPAQWAEWVSPYICLLVDTGAHRVLIDTGAGALGPDTGRLVDNLRKAGVGPSEIDTVILTHGHPDHIGGIADADGRLVFPKARFVMWKDEWRFWTSGRAGQVLGEHGRGPMLDFPREKLPPIAGRVDLVEDEQEIVPGVKAVAAQGHTPGHMALAIVSQGERLLCVSDALLHPIHAEHPDWYSAVDLDPQRAVASRRRLLNHAEAENALVFGFHLPFPGLGNVIKREEAWTWQPIESKE